MIKKIFINFLIIIILISLLKFLYIKEIKGALPDLILILVLINGIFNGNIYAMIFGFSAGLALDCIDYYPIIGFNALIYCILGYCTGITKLFNIENPLSFSIFLFIFYLLKSLIMLVFGFFFLDSDYIYNYFIKIFLLEIIFSLIISIPIFLIYKRFSVKTRKYSDNV